MGSLGLTPEDAIESLTRAPRERAESFNSDMSDDTDAMDRMLAAQAAAVANASAQRRSDGDIKELEIDHVCDRFYENMEEEAMLEILRDLQHELVPFAASALSSKPSVTTS